MNSLHTTMVLVLIWGGSTLAAHDASPWLWIPMLFAGGWTLGKLGAKARKYEELSRRVIRW